MRAYLIEKQHSAARTLWKRLYRSARQQAKYAGGPEKAATVVSRRPSGRRFSRMDNPKGDWGDFPTYHALKYAMTRSPGKSNIARTMKIARSGGGATDIPSMTPGKSRLSRWSKEFRIGQAHHRQRVRQFLAMLRPKPKKP